MSIIKSIILQPGEIFILPPGATITGAEDGITSDCTELPPISYERYVFHIEVIESDENATMWARQATYTTGLAINGIVYTFKQALHGESDFGGPNGVSTQMDLLFPGYFKNHTFEHYYTSTGTPNKDKYIWTFDCITTIGKSLYLGVATNGVGTDTSGEENNEVLIKAVKII